MSEGDTPQPGACRGPSADPPSDATVGVRWLRPDSTKVFPGSFSLLHCEVKGEGVYRGVFAVLGFPVTQPDRFVSLRYTNKEDKVREIGVIEKLEEFPDDQKQLIRTNLNKQYHEQVINRIFKVRSEYGLLFFDVSTQRGRKKFAMPWQQDRAEDIGERGKALTDALDNRYIIPDVSTLPSSDQRRFTAYVYW